MLWGVWYIKWRRAVQYNACSWRRPHGKSHGFNFPRVWTLCTHEMFRKSPPHEKDVGFLSTRMTSLTKLNCRRGHAHTRTFVSPNHLCLLSPHVQKKHVCAYSSDTSNLRARPQFLLSYLLKKKKKKSAICVIVKAALLGGENRVATWAVLKTRRSQNGSVLFFCFFQNPGRSAVSLYRCACADSELLSALGNHRGLRVKQQLQANSVAIWHLCGAAGLSAMEGLHKPESLSRY